LRAEEEARATIHYARRKISFGESEDAIYGYHSYYAEFSIGIEFGDLAKSALEAAS